MFIAGIACFLQAVGAAWGNVASGDFVPCSGLEIIQGRVNNRRVCFDGVVWGECLQASDGATNTELRVGTSDGPVDVRIPGRHPELAALRNCRVSVKGFCSPVVNARGEFLLAEVEACSPEDVRPLEPLPRPVKDVPGSLRGLLEDPSDPDGHLRRIRGRVVYVSVHQHFCLVLRQGETTGRRSTVIRVNASDAVDLPPVDAWVSAEGFPVRSGEYGVLEDAVFELLPGMGPEVHPELLAGRELQLLLARQPQPGTDYGYRFVRLVGRIVATEFSRRGRSILRLETPVGNLTAVLPRTDAVFPADLVDRPLAEVTGILDTRQTRNGRTLSIGDSRILLRSASDVRIRPDEVARRSALIRRAKRLILYALFPLVGFGLFVLLRILRRRAQSSAVAEDRRRIAENLHDAVSQQLAGARMMIFSVKKRDDLAPEAKSHLALAIDVLESARREVRGAVLKLKDDEFSLRSAKDLIRQGVSLVAARGQVRAYVRLGEFPSDMVGGVKSDLIAIIQEAVTNAIRHGRARRIAVLAGRNAVGRFVLSVLNDGAPFDARAALGPETGHFGLSGMHERAERSGFTLSFNQRRRWVEVRLERSVG